jgi:hypothetical protein
VGVASPRDNLLARWLSLTVYSFQPVGAITFVLVFGLFYIDLVVPMITIELKSRLSKYETSAALRSSSKRIVSVYRSIEILHIGLVELLTWGIFPLRFVFTNLILFCNFMLIRHFHDLDIPTKAILCVWSMMALCVWTIFLQFGGHLYTGSWAAIKSWKYFQWQNRFEGKIFGKVRKSMRPLKVGVGCYFTIKRLTVLKFLRGIVRGTMKALLAIRN